MRTFPRVAVLGLGTMGAGIAQVVAASGRDVVVLETDRARIDHGLDAVRTFLDGGVERGRTTSEQRDAVLGRIRGTTDVAELAGVDLVIEAVVEQHDVKVELLGRVADVVGAEAVLTTNTSALSVTDLAASLDAPGRMAGLHFFNPAPVMALVEVVRALQTDDGVVADLVAFVEDIGKSPVEVKDRPGFLVNRLLMPYLNDVVQEYDDGLASAEDIDVAIQLGLGYKLGPLALLDLIGIDVHRHATESAYAATLDPQFAPPPLLHQMVAAGYLGTKSGRGFRAGAPEHGEVR
ncbi:3-hydroxyacyl-CoA dehydrogenase family protein [Blastococcus sp. VKM Ac-2987]|uniref:3-hydroxyacyl-CoA dehydrogenase family protein n=1 Tax=Blastococcus sp. VKM Ac-2987 TaxID=3004141 RepID=UPI0022AB511B|nr:3-hydroxyacyl-CoA dehydrogenase NAD-binding domain-containing protein [Blastococcus sp. VKM Ac-2987]MCZ2860098.1 3-hydroxyacyl-CoA dehydrogenase NAD-binding domain-containing protein [Blastococcus sp. VKM Ac-2987]